MKASELRQMSVDQLFALLAETQEHSFRLKIQARMEKLDAPSELKKSRRLIARILTIQNERSQNKS
ncbi:MAG: 50S ribosomal protein L29 [Planctomycetaceae bacterium]|jgi:large subunit ribosomal protein L29|nr:50S ribosomal protein L29 [Planctomycetaceae bacterium]